MKILHTSDWHLGRSFGSVSLHDAQTQFCEWLLGVAVSEKVELLVVAGDLYDRSLPPQDSVVLWRETLTAFHKAGITVVAIAGNHDGADRVAAFDGLTDGARIFVRGGYGRAGEILTLQFSDGPLDIALVPFLDPQLAPPEWKAELAEAELRRLPRVQGGSAQNLSRELGEVLATAEREAQRAQLAEIPLEELERMVVAEKARRAREAAAKASDVGALQ